MPSLYAHLSEVHTDTVVRFQAKVEELKALIADLTAKLEEYKGIADMVSATYNRGLRDGASGVREDIDAALTGRQRRW